MRAALVRGVAPALMLAILGCGAATDPSSSTLSSESVAPQPAAPMCVPCTDDSVCADGPGKCAVSAGSSSGICAPVCSKEGFCTPDRMCVPMSDASGKGWYACVLRGEGCVGK